MTAATLGFILTGIFLNALAQLFLKAGANAVGTIHLTTTTWLSTAGKVVIQLPVLAGIVCYVASVVVWIIALSRVDVSIAYPMLSLGYVLNAVGAWYFLGEAVSIQRMLAIAIILVGVALLIRS
jgi:multidrug transporter EmrE-like cation transporter